MNHEPAILDLQTIFPEGSVDNRAIVIWDRCERDEYRQLFLEVAKISGVETRIIGREWRGDFLSGLKIVNEFENAIHVFTDYEQSEAVRKLMLVAGARRQRVVVYAPAPCEEDLTGLKAAFTRFKFRNFLAPKLNYAVRSADSIITSSGAKNLEKLYFLGWSKEKIVPFGTFSGPINANRDNVSTSHANIKRPLRVLHVGSEGPTSGLKLVEKAAKMANVELIRAGGWVSNDDLVRVMHQVDVFVAAALDEAWGVRVNHAILEGLPVIVSDGMGSSILPKKFNCGIAFHKGNLAQLASIFKRLDEDKSFLNQLKAAAQKAAAAISPKSIAPKFLSAVRG